MTERKKLQLESLAVIRHVLAGCLARLLWLRPVQVPFVSSRSAGRSSMSLLFLLVAFSVVEYKDTFF